MEDHWNLQFAWGLQAKLWLRPDLRGGAPPWTDEVRLSMHELSLSMPEPMLSLSMLILAKSDQSKSKSWLTKVPVRSKNPSNLVRKLARESMVWPETRPK